MNSQLQPHFLYNSLNTIYNLSLNKSDIISEVILKVSDFLDYILYQINSPKVLLVDEINHLKNLIYIEKLRFRDSLVINFEQKNICNDFMIAPLLLLPFLENAIKHGVRINGVLIVNILIKTDKNNLYFFIENNSSDINKNFKKKGIGLLNTKKRLEILYNDKYDLNILQENSKFKVYLNLKNYE